MKIRSFSRTAVGKYRSSDNKYDKEERPFRFRNRSFIGKQIMYRNVLKCSIYLLTIVFETAFIKYQNHSFGAHLYHRTSNALRLHNAFTLKALLFSNAYQYNIFKYNHK